MTTIISYTRPLFLNIKSCLFSTYIYKLTNYYNTTKDKQSKQKGKKKQKYCIHKKIVCSYLLLYNCVFPLKSEYDRILTKKIPREKHIYNNNAGKCIVVFS